MIIPTALMTNILDNAIAGKGLVTAFQRVVALPSRAIVGYEALARWPALNNPAPAEVFAYAEETGKLDLLDRVCIRAAVKGALQATTSTPGMLLLVNTEPVTSRIDPSRDSNIMRAADCFNLTFEITERGLLSNPRALLRKVAALRSAGLAIALDDVGSDPDSLALLDVVSPDMVKLDMCSIQHQPDRLQARIIAAVMAHHERTGAVICAEGIETDDHLEQALAYGATFGQGNLFGLPGELTGAPHGFMWPGRETYPPTSATGTTFELASDVLPTRPVRQQTLSELSKHMERIAVTAENPPIVLTTLYEDADSRMATKLKYLTIAERCPLLALFSQGRPLGMGPRVREVRLDPGDPMSRESTIVVLGPDTAAALIARERLCVTGICDGNADRRFDMAVTFDREFVTLAAQSLLARLI